MHRVDRSVDRIVFFKKSRVVVHQRLEVHTRKLLDSKLKQLYSKKKVIVWWPLPVYFGHQSSHQKPREAGNHLGRHECVRVNY
jgi:hypothetical protein